MKNLRFAANAKCIRNRAIVNDDASGEVLALRCGGESVHSIFLIVMYMLDVP